MFVSKSQGVLLFDDNVVEEKSKTQRASRILRPLNSKKAEQPAHIYRSCNHLSEGKIRPFFFNILVVNLIRCVWQKQLERHCL